MDIKNLILNILESGGEMSSSELAAAMGYTKITDAVGKAIRELLNEQKIVYLNPDNPRSRHQKLRLNNRDGEL